MDGARRTGYVTEVVRSGPEVGLDQKWSEVVYFQTTSSTSLGPAAGPGERSGPEVVRKWSRM